MCCYLSFVLMYKLLFIYTLCLLLIHVDTNRYLIIFYFPVKCLNASIKGNVYVTQFSNSDFVLQNNLDHTFIHSHSAILYRKSIFRKSYYQILNIIKLIRLLVRIPINLTDLPTLPSHYILHANCISVFYVMLFTMLVVLFSILFVLFTILFVLFSILVVRFSILVVLFSILFVLFSILVVLFSILFVLFTILFVSFSILFVLFSILFVSFSILFVSFSILFVLFSILHLVIML